MFGITPYERWMKEMPRLFDWGFDEKPSYYPLKIDIKEKDREYLLEAEVPGANKDEIDIVIKDDILTISVERKEEIKEEKENYIRQERRHGLFKRSFSIENVDQENIKAKFKNGILELRLPKKESTPKKENKITIE